VPGLRGFTLGGDVDLRHHSGVCLGLIVVFLPPGFSV